MGKHPSAFVILTIDHEEIELIIGLEKTANVMGNHPYAFVIKVMYPAVDVHSSSLF